MSSSGERVDRHTGRLTQVQTWVWSCSFFLSLSLSRSLSLSLSFSLSPSLPYPPSLLKGETAYFSRSIRGSVHRIIVKDALSYLASSKVKLPISPVPSVVLSTVSSWRMMATSSEVNSTSISMPSAP